MSDQKLLLDMKNVLYVDRIYASLSELRRRANEERKQNEIDLALAELRLFSQNGEDGVVNAILRAIGNSNNFFIEFGVGDGWSCNCRLLAEVFGWDGLFLEVDSKDHEVLQQRYVNTKRIKCEKVAITPNNINEIFHKYEVPERFGVLSIDIDGQDYWTWKALDSHFQPDVVVIEYNSALTPAKKLVEEQGLEMGLPLGETWGASQCALVELGKSKGYTLVYAEMAGVNLFFVREKTIQDRQLNFNKVVADRSPNYGLRGKKHSATILFGSGPKTNRAQIQLDND